MHFLPLWIVQYVLFRSTGSNFFYEYIFRVKNGIEKREFGSSFWSFRNPNIQKLFWRNWWHLAILSSKNHILSAFTDLLIDLNYLCVPSSLKHAGEVKGRSFQGVHFTTVSDAEKSWQSLIRLLETPLWFKSKSSIEK